MNINSEYLRHLRIQENSINFQKSLVAKGIINIIESLKQAKLKTDVFKKQNK